MAVSTQDWKTSVEDFFESRYTVVALLIILVICVAVVLWLVMSEDQYEREGNRLMTESKYEDAQNAYYLSLKSHTFGNESKARITYKIAQTYEATGDDARALDFLMELMKDYSDSKIYPKAKKLAEIIFDRFSDGPRPGRIRSTTELGKLRDKFRARYLKLVSLIEKNRSGIPASLVQAYEQYKESYQAYQIKFSADYKEAVKAETTERLRLLNKSKGGSDGNWDEDR